MTYSHDVKEYSSHIVTVPLVRFMSMRMIVQVWALRRAVELIVVVIVTKSIIRCYRRCDRISLRTPANPIQYWVV